MLCLLVSIATALFLFRHCKDAIELSTILFAILACLLGSMEHLQEAFGYARPISPMLWVLLVQSIVRRQWSIALAPLGLTAAVGMTLAYETLLVLRQM